MRVLVVYCHPVPESFCAAMRDRVVGALSRAGHEADLLDLYAEAFSPVLTEAERRVYNDRALDDPELQPHFARLRRAEALVFIYPTWWYGLPAMLKGWFDRVWCTDVAFRLPADGGAIVPMMRTIRKIGVVTTCGAPWWWSFLIGQPGRKTILRGIRAICAPRCETLYLAHYRMDASTPESRRAFLDKVAARFASF